MTLMLRRRSSFTSVAVMEKPEQLAIVYTAKIQAWLSPVALQRDRHFRLAAFVDDKQPAAIGRPGQVGLAVVPGEGSAPARRDSGAQEFLIIFSKIEPDEGLPGKD